MPDYPAFAEPEGFTRLPRSHGRLFSMLAALVAMGVAIGIANFLLVAHPVQQQLEADPKIRGLALTARYAVYVDPRALVLDLRAVEDAGPMEMFRAVFQSAAAFHRLGRRFKRVVLARSGKPVFVMEGTVYARIGADFAADPDPAPLIGMMLGTLLRPSGAAAFGSWEGGVLGRFTRQIEDANEAARQWAGSAVLRQDWSGAP
jgi:hypothetical protein